jgi:hypothetical protein
VDGPELVACEQRSDLEPGNLGRAVS